MRKFLLPLSLVLVLVLVLAAVAALALGGIEAPKSCKQCGMDRTMFAQSRMIVNYADGTSAGTCSLHCAAANAKGNSGRKIKSLQVADCRTRSLMDAKQAVWVIGGKKRGVMTALPKWAFARKDDAEAFVKMNGGKIASFGEAMALAEKE
jgi:copper chaperone NosL